MKRVFVVAFLALAVVAAGCTQAPKQDVAADKAKLEADAVNTWFDHFSKGDSDSVANLYAEDAVAMPPNAPAVSGRAAIKSFLGQMIAQTRGAKMSLKNGGVTGSDVSGDMGWVSGAYSVVDSTGATVDTGKFLSVHHRVNGAWLYVRDTWNSDMPMPSPQPAPASKAGMSAKAGKKK